jgi:hypothetical protein
MRRLRALLNRRAQAKSSHFPASGAFTATRGSLIAPRAFFAATG